MDFILYVLIVLLYLHSCILMKVGWYLSPKIEHPNSLCKNYLKVMKGGHE